MAEYLCDPGDEAEVQASALCPALLVAGACHQPQASYEVLLLLSSLLFVLGLVIVIFFFSPGSCFNSRPSVIF
jgi:hypothetical protein